MSELNIDKQYMAESLDMERVQKKGRYEADIPKWIPKSLTFVRLYNPADDSPTNVYGSSLPWCEASEEETFDGKTIPTECSEENAIDVITYYMKYGITHMVSLHYRQDRHGIAPVEKDVWNAVATKFPDHSYTFTHIPILDSTCGYDEDWDKITNLNVNEPVLIHCYCGLGRTVWAMFIHAIDFWLQSGDNMVNLTMPYFGRTNFEDMIVFLTEILTYIRFVKDPDDRVNREIEKFDLNILKEEAIIFAKPVLLCQRFSLLSRCLCIKYGLETSMLYRYYPGNSYTPEKFDCVEIDVRIDLEIRPPEKKKKSKAAASGGRRRTHRKSKKSMSKSRKKGGFITQRYPKTWSANQKLEMKHVSKLSAKIYPQVTLTLLMKYVSKLSAKICPPQITLKNLMDYLESLEMRKSIRNMNAAEARSYLWETWYIIMYTAYQMGILKAI